MKKSFFFALAAFALTFVACENKTLNEPMDPTTQDSIVTPGDYDAKDYIGTRWRIDSVYVNDIPSPHPYVIVRFISETQAVLDGEDTTTWSIKDGAINIRRYDYEEMQSYKIMEANKTFAHLFGSDGVKEELNIYASIIPEAEGDSLPLTAENIIGKWRGDYYVSSGRYIGNDSYWHEYYSMTSSVQYHGLDIWEFFADGTLTYTNMLDKALSGDSYQPHTGFWEIKDGQFAYQYDVDRLYDGFYFNVEALTDNVFHIMREDFTATNIEYHWCHFSKVK